MEKSDANFGKRVKALRESLGMSQDELAQRCGYTSRSSIAKIETGHVDLPGSKKLALFAEALHTSTSYLVAGIKEDEISWVRITPVDDLPDDETMKLAEELRNRPGMRLLFDAAKSCKEEDLINVADFISKLRKGDDD